MMPERYYKYPLAWTHLLRRYALDTLSPYAQKGKITFIYALLEPDTNDVRYIGKSDNPKRRFQNHLTDKRKNHRTSWIKSLKNKGQEPLLIILEEVAFEIWQIRERHWISFYREKGADLVNMTDGGEGGYLGEEATARASLKKRGKKHTDEHKRKISEGCKGHFVSEGSKQRWAELGKNKSEETKRKIGEASKGRTLSQEARMKISEKLKKGVVILIQKKQKDF